MSAVAFVVLFAAICCYQIWCMQVIPERVLYMNKKYVENVTFFVKRFTCRGNYYFNIEGTTSQVWTNNVTVHLFFYEYLHNEYKRSFVEMHFRLCDMVNKDPYVGKALANSGMPCPLPKGKVAIKNITIPTHEFPNVWPFERCKVDVRIQLTSNEELMLNMEAYIYFKNRDETFKNPKNKKLPSKNLT